MMAYSQSVCTSTSDCANGNVEIIPTQTTVGRYTLYISHMRQLSAVNVTTITIIKW